MTEAAKQPSTATRRTGGSQPTLNGHGPASRIATQDLASDATATTATTVTQRAGRALSEQISSGWASGMRADRRDERTRRAVAR